MNIYFAGSIKGGREDVPKYVEIINYLKLYGSVLTEHVASPSISDKGEVDKKPEFIHDRDIAWLNESDIVIAEVTKASLGVGYELGFAVNLKKPVLALFDKNSEKSLSNMIKGSFGITVKEYSNLDEAKEYINSFISSL